MALLAVWGHVGYLSERYVLLLLGESEGLSIF